MDFFTIKERSPRKGVVEIYPDFKVARSEDLMTRGNDFYAVWDQQRGVWSTDQHDVQRLVDSELYEYASKRKQNADDVVVKVLSMDSFSSKSWTQFKNYMRMIPDSYTQLDDTLTFSNSVRKKADYVSKSLPYPLEAGDFSAYDELISTLYDPDERMKLEWAIGSIVAGDGKDIQKFIVLYGDQGAGKSTILNIIQRLFVGYFCMFDAKALASNNNSFSTDVFRGNPLVAIQHDGDLSKIEDNTKINSIVSHELMVMNEKFKSSYMAKTNCFLFMATNRPVKITDAKSGIIRRLIDVRPSGRKLPPAKYEALMQQINFELGAIAEHCRSVYSDLGKNYYNTYRPLAMIFQTDVFFNFVESEFEEFNSCDGVSLSRAYDMYKKYCDESLVDFKLPRHRFREELKNYFKEFLDITRVEGRQVRSYYRGFESEKFTSIARSEEAPVRHLKFVLDQDESLLDDILKDMPAQYAKADGTPESRWASVRTKLSDVDTRKLHYVKVPENHIVIDFDIKEGGEKSPEKNLEAANEWPSTYAEFSKGGGLHLHYIYNGDVRELSRIYSESIEVKVFNGDSALRRKLSKCNNVPIATLNSGLPKKRRKNVVDFSGITNEKTIRKSIERNLRKEIHAATKPSIDMIYKILDDAYNSGAIYDVRDMRNSVLSFAMQSTNNRQYCVKRVSKMKFMSEEQRENAKEADGRIVFFDVEVFPNLFLVCWKYEGENCAVVRMVNPSPEEIETLMKMKLVGFNCRKYDNHILYARYLGYTNEKIYELSKRIIGTHSDGLFSEAYNLSYTDIYDFSSQKQSLKKFEIELGIHHQELGLPWDEPVPEELWDKVAEYCEYDVLATEATFHARKADWLARNILADVAGMTVNDTTNSLTTRIIFGRDHAPQSQFNYRFLGDTSDIAECGEDGYSALNSKGQPVFPGYEFRAGKSTYRGAEVGEGGRVYSNPGIHYNVALLDIASMHPSSIVAENLFGEYTQRFKDILDARIAIKHKDYEKAKIMLGGALARYLEDKDAARDLAYALKIAINSVYGLTSARFSNPFKDPRNVDNIVAKRGALFMVDLQHEVEKRGFTVAHIKTDSIKIPDATPEIIQFVQEYGSKRGYNFELEAIYERMCLVNDAVYIARYAQNTPDSEKAGQWTATGAQFAHPYVFKKLFSKEDICFKDLCETKSVTTEIFIDANEGLPDVSEAETELDIRNYNLAHPEKPKKSRTTLHALSDDELKAKIAEGHDYIFIGRVGLFCPIKPGCGGGLLLARRGDKMVSVTGAKDYRWLEAEVVKKLGKENDVDLNYHRALVDAAIDNISNFGDFDAFAGIE